MASVAFFNLVFVSTMALLAADPPPATVVPVPSTEDRAAAAGWGTGNWLKQHKDINRLGKERSIEIVLLGDSITQSWGGKGRSVGSPAAPVWQEHFGGRVTANCGISGDRTQHVLWRIANGNLDHVQPRFVVLLIGTNNLGHDSPEDIAAGIHAIVDQVGDKTPNATILLCGIIRGGTADDPTRKHAERVNELIRPLGDRERVRYVDLPACFYSSDGKARPDLMRGDFVHFTNAGYRAWAKTLEPLLKPSAK